MPNTVTVRLVRRYTDEVAAEYLMDEHFANKFVTAFGESAYIPGGIKDTCILRVLDTPGYSEKNYEDARMLLTDLDR